MMTRRKHPRGWSAINSNFYKKYESAVTSFLEINGSNKNLRGVRTEEISELKGIFSRPINQDRPDFARLWTYLGRPERRYSKEVIEKLYGLAQSLRKGNWNTAERYYHELHKVDFVKRLQIFQSQLRVHQSFTLQPNSSRNGENADRLSNNCEELPKPAEGIVEIVHLKNLHDINVNERISKFNNSESTPSTAMELDLTELRRRQLAHEVLLEKVCQYLAPFGYPLRESLNLDLLCLVPAGALLFEIKTILPGNEVSQIRKAVSQLYEYRFNYQINGSLWLVLSNPLSKENEWIIAYLISDRDINLLWLENDAFHGPSLANLQKLLTESVNNPS